MNSKKGVIWILQVDDVYFANKKGVNTRSSIFFLLQVKLPVTYYLITGNFCDTKVSLVLLYFLKSGKSDVTMQLLIVPSPKSRNLDVTIFCYRHSYILGSGLWFFLDFWFLVWLSMAQLIYQRLSIQHSCLSDSSWLNYNFFLHLKAMFAWTSRQFHPRLFSRGKFLGLSINLLFSWDD